MCYYLSMNANDQALLLARNIFECEAKLAELKAAHARLFGQGTANAVVLKPIREGKTESAPSKILAYMAERRGESVLIREIAEATGLAQLEVGRTVSRLSRDGRIENTGRGEYRLPLEAQEETPA